MFLLLGSKRKTRKARKIDIPARCLVHSGARRRRTKHPRLPSASSLHTGSRLKSRLLRTRRLHSKTLHMGSRQFERDSSRIRDGIARWRTGKRGEHEQVQKRQHCVGAVRARSIKSSSGENRRRGQGRAENRVRNKYFLTRIPTVSAFLNSQLKAMAPEPSTESMFQLFKSLKQTVRISC